MTLNFSRYTGTLALCEDLSLSYYHTPHKCFILTRNFDSAPPENPDKKGWITPEIETVGGRSLFEIEKKMREIGISIVTPPNWPGYPA